MQRLSREAFIRFSNVLLQRIRGLKVSNKRNFFRKLAKNTVCWQCSPHECMVRAAGLVRVARGFSVW